MTCVAGFVQHGDVFLGADSSGTAGWDRTHRRDTKVFRVGEFVLGFTSSFRMGQLLRFKLDPPELPDAVSGVDLFQYMVTDFVDALRTTFKDGGFARSKNDEESGGVFLVGVRGRLFKVDADYQVGESLDGYDACGCGEAYALGVLHVTRIDPPFNRLELALKAAAHHNAGVCGPFNYVRTP